MYVDLRIHNKKDNYKRVESRTHHDLLELQKDVDTCDPVEINDLFRPEREGAFIPKRLLVIGKAGIGKTMLTMHILDKWINGQLPPPFRYIFYFALRDLSYIGKSSQTDLFFEHHDQEITKPSDHVIAEFFKLISACPDQCLLIMDGLDECKQLSPNAVKYEHNEKVEMRKLLSSIIQGQTLKRVTVLVTSRPGSITDYNMYDKTAEIYGLTQSKILEYISKFCRGDNQLKTCIEEYITANTNIASLCYIPVQCGLICQIVRAKEKHHIEEQLPATVTQLYITAVEHLMIEQHPRFKAKEIGANDNVVGQLREPLLNHATLARDGMGESPVKVTFSEDDIKALHLEEAATECGLLTVSKEKKGTVLRKHSSIYTFNHLTVQELLGAVALVSSPQKAESMMVKSANDGQLDLLLMFLCGLIGDHVNKKFLDTLGCQINMTPERLLKLVIQREYEKTERHRIQMIADSSISVCDQLILVQFDRQRSALLMLLMIFESQHPELWSTVKNYAKEDGDTLNLSHMHISPVELQAMTFIFQNSDFNSLK